MTPAVDHIELPLELLFRRLEDEKFVLDPARKLRAWRALNAQGSRMAGDMEALKYLLCPLLARSAKEQERFYDVFESFWKECIAEHEKTAGPPDASSVQPGGNTKQRRGYGALMWAIPALALVGVLWYFMTPPQANHYIRRPVAAMDYEASNGTLTLKNTSEHYDSTRAYWLITDPETGAVLHSDSAQHTVFRAADGRKKVSVLLKVCARPSEQLPQDTVDWPDSLFAAVQQTVLLHCPKPPKANWVIKPQCNCLPSRVEFYVDTDQGNMVSWEMRMGALYVRSAGSSANMTISQAGSMTVKARVVDPQGCETQLDTTLQIGNNKPFLRFQKLAYAAPLLVLEVSGLGWLIALLPLFPAGYFLYLWWKKRYRKSSQKTPDETDAKYAVIDAPPYYIPYRSQEEKVTIPREFFRIAEVLRRREESERRAFDAGTSITATIEQGGFPVWRERSITRPADYLFLIKRPDEFDQQTRLFQRFARFLEERDAPVIVYYHDGHFERFRNADMPDGIDLRDLYRRHSACRLVLLGDAHELVNAYAHPVPALLKAPLEALLRWPRRLLLTPEPVSAWSYQEALLQQVFPLYPADTRGMLEGLEQLDRLEEYDPEPFERHKTALQALHHGANPRYCNFNDADACLDYLAGDQQLQRWLRALAVCSRPDWALTIAIGRAIGMDVTHDRLLALSRIPWLRNNQPDDALRLRLLAQLPPDDERAARQALVEELEKVEEQVQEGFARTDWQTSLAVQHFALDPGDSAHRDTLERLQQLGLLSGAQQAELNWLVKKAGFVANDGEDAFATWLQNSKHWLNRELTLALSFTLLSGLMLLANYNMLRYTVPPYLSSLQVIKPYYDEAMASNNRAVALHDTAMAETSYSRWLAYAEALQQADTLFGRAVVLRAPGGYALADSNRWALGYNRAARVLNFFLNDAIDASQPPSPRTGEPYSKAALQSAATRFNELAGQVYWNNTDTRRLEAQHGMGLCHYYLGDMAVARKAYDLIASAAPVYFDTLGMEVNLRTLLNVKLPPPYLRVLVLDASTGAPLANVEVDPVGSPAVISNSRGMAVYQYRAAGNDRQVETTARVQGYRDWTGMTTRWTADGVMDTIRMVAWQKIEILVTDAATELPVANAQVSIKETGWSNQLTSSEGKVFFENVPIGALTVHVTKVDYQLYTQQINIGNQTGANLFKISLLKTPAVPNSSQVTVAGQVTDSKGRIVKDAQVTIETGRESLGMFTNSTGSYSLKFVPIPGVPQSKIYIEAKKDSCMVSDTIILDSKNVVVKDFRLDCNKQVQEPVTGIEGDRDQAFIEGWPSKNGVVVGDKIGNFGLLNVDGRYVALSDYKDVKGYIIIFFSNHDPYSQLYEGRVIALHRKFAPSGFPVIAISPNSPLVIPEDSYEEMIKRSKTGKYPFAYLYDGDQQLVYPKFGATRTPHVFVIDKDYLVRYTGAIDDNPESLSMVKNRYVENAVNALLKGETPDPFYTRPMGLTVKKKPK